ncbi:PEP/pyruvate-binding domain-containing protein [Pseudomonas aeruginosa]|uniref:PEP/pyruvate-binding domain-containing protein n=1 Tax=Pseudomonas aeruginosa TaxID=287 RepID=UPI004046A027
MLLITETKDLLDPNQVGFKFSRQAQMYRDGFSVPPFHCIPATVFDKILDAIKMDPPSLVNRKFLLHWAADIRKQLKYAHIDELLTQELLSSFDRLAGPEGYVAVRACVAASSDGVGEDSDQDPFAGLSDSFLYVSRKELLQRVRECWASGFNDEAILYRLERGLSPLGVRVAVGIQTMVCGTRSFVAFSLDPRGGDNHCVVAAAYGIGEGVVQDKADTDHFFYQRRTGNITSKLTKKNRQAIRNSDLNATGVVVRPVPSELIGKPVLTEEEVRSISSLALKLEAYFNSPQDIEGTITEDCKIYIVQARPIGIDLRIRHFWSNNNITESFPGTTTALTYSFAQEFYSTIFSNLYRRLGVKEDLLRANKVHLDQMIGFLNGRIYYRLDDWYILHSMLPIFPFFCSAWEQMMGVENLSLSDSITLPNTSRWRKWLSITGATIKTSMTLLQNKKNSIYFEEWWEQLFGYRRGKSLSQTLPLTRIEDFYASWRQVGEWWGITLINDILLSNTSILLRKLLTKYIPEAPESLFRDILCGDEENRSSAILFSTIGLAEQARTHSRFLSKEDDKELWTALDKGEFGLPLRQAFLNHLHHYGDRGLDELKLEKHSLRENPVDLLRLVRHYADSELSIEKLKNNENSVRQDAENTIKKALGRSSWKCLLILFISKRARLYASFRENSRYCRSELFGYARQIAVSLGEDLVKHGILSEVSDVYHLTWKEVFGYFEGTGSSHALQKLSNARRVEYEQQRAELPISFFTYDSVPQALPSNSVEELLDSKYKLQGIGSSRGVVRGVARVILDPRQAIANSKEMILIARETDPAWLFLMLTAKGIVVERGTMLSHTAITSRKFGIPSVVSVPNVTRIIPDGAYIEIDGTTGVVTILDHKGSE